MARKKKLLRPGRGKSFGVVVVCAVLATKGGGVAVFSVFFYTEAGSHCGASDRERRKLVEGVAYFFRGDFIIFEHGQKFFIQLFFRAFPVFDCVDKS